MGVVFLLIIGNSHRKFTVFAHDHGVLATGFERFSWSHFCFPQTFELILKFKDGKSLFINILFVI